MPKAMTDAAMYAGTARLSLRRTVQSSILALIAHLDRHAWLLRFELPRAVFLFGDGILTTPALTGPQSRPPRPRGVRADRLADRR